MKLFRTFLNGVLFSLLTFFLLAGCTGKKEQRVWPGLVGAYYGNADLTRIKMAEVLNSMDNTWNEDTGHGSAWSAQYEGFIVSSFSGPLTIYFESDKAVSFQINEMTGSADSSSGVVSRTFESEKGLNHYIRISFFFMQGDSGGFRVSWSWPGQEKVTIPAGNFVYNARQSEKWNVIPEPDPDTIDYALFLKPKKSNHVTVFYQEGKFAGWPANGGIWIWADEIVVNFTVGVYQEKENHHSIDESQPQQSVLARSLDGGENWLLEGTFKIHDSETENLPAVDFSHPDLAIKVFRNNFVVSYDRCKTWSGYYPFPGFGYEKLTSRTDYISLDKNTCLFFLSYEDETVQAQLADKAFAAVTRDGGKTIEKLADIAPYDNYRAVMPSSVLTGENHIVSALRRRFDREFDNKKPKLPTNWIDIFESRDLGQSWRFLSRAAETDMGKHNGNPPGLVKMADGRLCLTYGYRAQPYGIRARLSKNNGKTWGEEIHLRDHAREFDLGYTRSVQRKDGRIVTIYYFNTDDIQEQFISATIWDPDSLDKG